MKKTLNVRIDMFQKLIIELSNFYPDKMIPKEFDKMLCRYSNDLPKMIRLVEHKIEQMKYEKSR